MPIRSARFILFLTLALFCIVPPSLSEPGIEIVKDSSSDPRPQHPAGTPSARPGPQSPRPGRHAPRPAASDIIYTVPKSLTPLTNKATCGNEGAGCCERTKLWCIGEGFVWQACKRCFCAAQCFAPDASSEPPPSE